MNCDICGGTETYLQDGIEYCRECSEQIKGSIDEVVGEESCTKKSLLSKPAKKAKKDKTMVLSPWLFSEAYSLILSKQVEALIKLGCSEKLKTVVLCIWARYLQKCESAFIASDNEEFIPRLSLFPVRRDIELLYGEGLYSNLEKIVRPNSETTKRKIYKKRNPKTEFPTDSVTEVSEVSGDESSGEIKKEIIPNILYSSHAKTLKKKRLQRKGKGTHVKVQNICVSHMSISKTLSFCHLGLLYTEDQMLLFDLIRLVNDGAVPYIDVTRHFPTAMQVQSQDAKHLNKSAAPDIRKLCLISAQLMNFLQLPKFKQPPLLPIAIRFVKDLNLPCDLIPVLKFLINRINENSDEQFVRRDNVKPTSRNFPLPLYEAQAMSVVAVALKMLFVLDGKFEMEHSEIMTKLNLICKDQTYFVWKDWQKQMALKEYLFIKKYSVNQNTMNCLDNLSADRINAGYPITLLHQELKTYRPELKIANSNRIELESQIKKLVKNSSIEKNSTSFPLQYELNRLMIDWKKMPLYKDTENVDFTFINKDFSHHKLYYRPSAKTDESMNLLLTSLYESVQLIHVTECDDYYENIIRTSEKYWYLPVAFSEFKTTKWEDNFPSSFEWLFNFMCNYLQVDKCDFYKEFKYIEHKVIPEL